MSNITKVKEINNFIGKNCKEPINETLSIMILSLMRCDYRQFKNLKIFDEWYHADISDIIYNDNDAREEIKKFLTGWRTEKEEIKLIIRIELYKHIILKNIREIRRKYHDISYRITEQGEKFLNEKL